MLRVISVESGKYVVEIIFKLIRSDFYEFLYFISWIHNRYISNIVILVNIVIF